MKLIRKWRFVQAAWRQRQMLSGMQALGCTAFPHYECKSCGYVEFVPVISEDAIGRKCKGGCGVQVMTQREWEGFEGVKQRRL